MKLDWLRADIASARRASALLVLLLACSMLANVTLAAFAMHMAGTAAFAALRLLEPQSLLIQLFGELLSLAAQAAFAFASWRVAAEYEAKVGPTAAR